jgi:hypothetical protein
MGDLIYITNIYYMKTVIGDLIKYKADDTSKMQDTRT